VTFFAGRLGALSITDVAARNSVSSLRFGPSSVG
jgi:hypothetical protein